MAKDGPRVDGAEAHLLLAELSWLKSKLGEDAAARAIGRNCDGAFFASCIALYSVPRRMKANGYPFDLRSGPTAVLEEALDKLWYAAPEVEFWRARK